MADTKLKPGGIGWYPADPRFRKQFEIEMRRGIAHFGLHGDLRRIIDLVEPISDRQQMIRIVRRLAELLPIQLRIDGSFIIDKLARRTFDWDNVPELQLWPARMKVVDGDYIIGGEIFSASELIDEVANALVLSRAGLKSSELLRLQETLDSVVAYQSRRRIALTSEAHGGTRDEQGMDIE